MEKTDVPTRVARFFLVQKYQNWKNLPNYNELYLMSIKYNKRPYNGPSVHKIYQHLPVQDPPNLTQSWIFGLKTNHLATLVPTYLRPFSHYCSASNVGLKQGDQIGRIFASVLLWSDFKKNYGSRQKNWPLFSTVIAMHQF
jgi:hypothetical protein